MNVRVQFFKNGSEPLLATNEQKQAYKELRIISPFVEQGWIDIDTKEDSSYFNLLLHSDFVEVMGGIYKVKTRQFKALSPYALWIEVEKIY